MSTERVTIRYSTAFKRKVITEIERGTLTVQDARRVYDIRGGATIQRWLKNHDKSHLLTKVVRVAMKDETDRVKEQAVHIQQLEKALAHAQLQILAMQSTIEVIEETYGPIKKKSDTPVSPGASQRAAQNKRKR